LPDIVTKVVAEHALAFWAAGIVLVAILLGPWALIRVAMMRKAPPRDGA
jgi:hypothetical protein